MNRHRDPRAGIAWFCAGRRHLAPVVMLALGALISGCTKERAAPAPRPAIPVEVQKVVQKTVPLTVSAIGNVEAYSTVSIRAQVAGELLDVHFKEGDFVRKGQLLFTIDPRPYQAAAAQSQANLARDKAIAANNRAQADRYKKLFAEGVVPAQDVESYTATATASDATVQADEAALKTAQLNLSYCTIYSPLDGRTGSVMVKPGNLIKVSDVPIVVINQVNPIYVNFTVPQQYLPEVKKYMALHPLQVEATVPNDSGPVERGTLTFVDNAVDSSTGTIHLKATFTNTRDRLWPGLFVNTVMRLSEQANATVVPSQAISTGQQGQFVYVVKSDNTVESRAVVTSRTVEGDTVIEKGLRPGETVVTDGQLRLVPGAKVQIKNRLSGAGTLDGAAGPIVR
jgi:membrane fusion protein, multidrug efflux system